MAQLPVGRSRSLARACGQQALVLCMQQQAYVAYVVLQARVVGSVRQHQKLHRKLGVNHAAGAVFEIEQVCRYRIGCAQFVTHGYDF